MIGKFLRDRCGNYALMTAVALVPVMGGLAIAVDYAEMNRQQAATLNALDAAGLATARQIVTGASDDELIAYANDFFEANLSDVDPADTELSVMLPNNTAGGGLRSPDRQGRSRRFEPDRLQRQDRNPAEEHAGGVAGPR